MAKRVLIGINYCDHNDNLLEQKQLHGTIIKADAKQGFAIRLEGQTGGELFVVIDPDFVTEWTINRPPDDAPSNSP